MGDFSLSRRQLLAGAVGVAAGAALPAAPAQAAPGTRLVGAFPAAAALDWTRTSYELVLRENLSPPAAARAYACTAIAMYEAVVAGMPGHRSLAGQVTDLRRMPPVRHRGQVDWPTALVVTAAEVLRAVLPFAGSTTRQLLDDSERDALAARRAAGATDRSMAAAREHARGVAAVLVRWVQSDGYAGTLGRELGERPADPWRWESTPPNYRPAIEPHWSEVRPLVLRSADEVVPAPPVPFSDQPGSPFWDQAMVPYRQSFANTEEHEAIARFWTDNPGSFTPPFGTPTGLPSGHWMLLGVQGLELREARLDLAVETLALTGVALHDAFLNCWTWKYRFDLLRPITYVRRYIDSTWSTLINTPQFPEHTSGHSVASPAAAAVLTASLGTFPFTDSTHSGRQPARAFTSYSHAAREAAQSRIYGGIHYPHGVEAGFTQGEAVGALVLRRLRTSR